MSKKCPVVGLQPVWFKKLEKLPISRFSLMFYIIYDKKCNFNFHRKVESVS